MPRTRHKVTYFSFLPPAFKPIVLILSIDEFHASCLLSWGSVLWRKEPVISSLPFWDLSCDLFQNPRRTELGIGHHVVKAISPCKDCCLSPFHILLKPHDLEKAPHVANLKHSKKYGVKPQKIVRFQSKFRALLIFLVVSEPLELVLVMCSRFFTMMMNARNENFYIY